MGKNKSSKRLGARRLNPLSASFDEQIESDLNGDAEYVPSMAMNIIEQLQDPSKEERALGCQHLARIVAKPKAVELLLKHDVVKIVAPLFLDPCVDVQRSALGSMRNMSMFGEETVCDVMVKSDVITPLSFVIKKFGDGPTDCDTLKRETASSILLEAVELLSNLCENNTRALQMFNKEEILSVLLPLLNTEVLGYPVAIAVAHCLHIVSENNADVSIVCKEPGVLSQLMNIVTSTSSSIDAVLLRTRIIGIILNLSEVDLTPYYDGFIKLSGEVLEMDCLPLISMAVENNSGTATNENTDVDLSQQDVDKLVSAQRVSLESLANLCCFDDEWEETEDDGLEELSGDDDQVDCSGDATGQEAENMESLCLSSEIHSAFFNYNILEKILKKAHPLEPSQVVSLEPLHCGKGILQRFEDLQARALLCLSNMIGSVYETSQSQTIQITLIWTELYGLAKSYQGSSEDFMWAVTSALRSVLQKMSEIDEKQIKNVSQADLEFLVQIGKVSNNPETQINVIRLISIIGCALALNSQQQHLVKVIGEILLQVCATNEDVVVVAETMDSLFDVFKEDETDPVAKEIDLVQNLKTIGPAFKSKISKKRKKLGEHHGIVMMAKANLSAFVKYKVARHL